MSTYYYLVNLTKHEYVDSDDLGYGLKKYSYYYHMSPLFTYLMLGEWWAGGESTYDPNDKEFSFKGHWKGDNVELVSEHNDIYEDIGNFELYGTQYGNNHWTNISKPLRDEWNKEVEEDFKGDEEMIKKLTV